MYRLWNFRNCWPQTEHISSSFHRFQDHQYVSRRMFHRNRLPPISRKERNQLKKNENSVASEFQKATSSLFMPLPPEQLNILELHIHKYTDQMDSVLKSPSFRSFKHRILAFRDYTCAYCGFRGESSFQFETSSKPSKIKVENYILVCALCHRIRNCGFYGIKNQLALIGSTLPQLEIVHKTWQHFEKHLEFPSPFEIDPEAKLLSRSTRIYALEIQMKTKARILREYELGLRKSCDPKLYRGYFLPSFKKDLTDALKSNPGSAWYAPGYNEDEWGDWRRKDLFRRKRETKSSETSDQKQDTNIQQLPSTFTNSDDNPASTQ